MIKFVKAIDGFFFEHITEEEWKTRKAIRDEHISNLVSTSYIFVVCLILAWIAGDAHGGEKANEKMAELRDSDPYKKGYKNGFDDGVIAVVDTSMRLAENDEYRDYFADEY